MPSACRGMHRVRLGALLDELKLLDVHHLAAELAGKVQARLSRGAESRGVRQAEYDVLAGVNVPAVLVELVSRSATRWRDDDRRQRRIADALTNGITDYLGVRRLAYFQSTP